MVANPFIEHIQAPGTRPIGLADDEVLPRAPHGARIHVLPQRRREIRQILRETHAERTSEPDVPRQSECSLGLADDFIRQQVGKRLDQQGFRNIRRVFHALRQPADKLHEAVVEEWHADLERIGHAGGVGVAQKRIHHVRLQFETGNGSKGIKPPGLPRRLPHTRAPGIFTVASNIRRIRNTGRAGAAREKA